MASPTQLTDLNLSGNLTVIGDQSMATGKQVKPFGGTATASAGAATCSQQIGVITTESLSTAAGSAYTLTLTNTLVAATSIVLVAIANGSNSAGLPLLLSVAPGAGSVVIKIQNAHATVALNGTMKVYFLVLNPA